MKLPWIIAGIGLVATAYLLRNSPEYTFATDAESLDDAASSATRFGTAARLRGAGGKFVGKAKQTVGELTGDEHLANDGTYDQVGGALKEAAGTVAQAAGHTVHELNR